MVCGWSAVIGADITTRIIAYKQSMTAEWATVGAVVLKRITYMKGTIKMIVVIETKNGRKAYSTDAPEELAQKLKGEVIEVL